jgi:hypothetical protein
METDGSIFEVCQAQLMHSMEEIINENTNSDAYAPEGRSAKASCSTVALESKISRSSQT